MFSRLNTRTRQEVTLAFRRPPTMLASPLSITSALALVAMLGAGPRATHSWGSGDHRASEERLIGWGGETYDRLTAP
jgi:hypothetical protein